MTIQPSSADTDEPMNVTEPIRCGLARAAAGYESGIELEDIAALIDAYDRLAIAQSNADPSGLNPGASGASMETDPVTGHAPVGSVSNSFRPTQGGDKGEAVAWRDKIAFAYLLGRGMQPQSIDDVREYQGETWLNALDETESVYAAPQPASIAYSAVSCGADRIDDEDAAFVEKMIRGVISSNTLDAVVKFEDCQSAEPTLRQIIRQYYIQGLQPDTDRALEMAERFIAALPRSSVLPSTDRGGGK